MKLAQIQFSPWDKIYYFNSNDLNLAKSDKVIVETELGMEIGTVVGFMEKSGQEDGSDSAGCGCPNKSDCGRGCGQKSEDGVKERKIKPVLRKATTRDLEKQVSREEQKKALEYCKEVVNKLELPMKLIGVNFSFDQSRATFAFISDGRVDFRELVKDLTRHFNRTVRLQQIGIRDEAKVMGDYGHCGRQLCCKKFLPGLISITSDMAEIQQCAHRGSERISGVCGRLMCCLAYENKGYEELTEKMPATGKNVKVDGKRGVVIGRHALKQTVDVKFAGEKGENGSVVEVDLNRNKK